MSDVVVGRLVGAVEAAFYEAVDAADWLTEADAAGLQALARLAELIDTAPVDAQGMLIRGYLKALGDFGFSPFGRGRIDLEETADNDDAQLIALVSGTAG